ncbi:MAG: OmpA family protein [Pseudomonadota bacterium]
MTGIRATFVVLVAAGVITGCTRADGTRNNTATQAVAGTAAGALIGNLIGDGDETATVIGGVVGGIAGTAVGSYLDRQQRDLQASIGGSGAQIVNTGSSLVVSLPEAITFDVNSSDVRPDIRDEIIAISQNLQAYPSSTVQVVGHTDNTGSASFNQGLSDRRAQAVTNILVASGTPAGRIVTIGRGEGDPVASNDTEAGRTANRRVEIIITPSNNV